MITTAETTDCISGLCYTIRDIQSNTFKRVIFGIQGSVNKSPVHFVQCYVTEGNETLLVESSVKKKKERKYLVLRKVFLEQ